MTDTSRLCTAGVQLALLFCPRLAMACQVESPCDPVTFESKSGRWTLAVDPDSRDGTGGARYVLRCDGVTAWDAWRPYTLRQAVVRDDGTVAGLSYSNLEAMAGARKGERGPQTHIMNPAGGVQHVEVIDRDEGDLDEEHRCRGEGIICLVDEERSVLSYVSVGQDNEANSWWKFDTDLATMSRQPPPSCPILNNGAAARICSIIEIQGTPLVLVAWAITGGDKYGPVETRCTIAVADTNGRTFWHCTPFACTGVGFDSSWFRAKSAMNKTFTVESDLELEERTFRIQETVTPDAPWSVVNVVTRSVAVPAAVEPLVTAEATVLDVGAIILSNACPEGMWEEVLDIDMDLQGRIGFVDTQGAFWLMSSQRATSASQKWNVANGSRCVGLDETHWALACKPNGGGRGHILGLDTESGESHVIVADQGSGRNAIAATPEGGLVVVAQWGSKFTLTKIDSAGREIWSRECACAFGPSICMPDQIAVTREGDIAVLDSVGSRIHMLDRHGQYNRAVLAVELWGGGSDGRIAIGGSNDAFIAVCDTKSNEVCRVDVEGRVIGRTQLAVPCNRQLSKLMYCIDGNKLWGTDSLVVMGFDGLSGALSTVVGGGMCSECISLSVRVASDCQGRILVEDAGTGVVHVYDVQGRRLFACVPAWKMDTCWTTMTSLASGDIVLGGNSRYQVFGSDGSRKQSYSSHSVDRSEIWFGRPCDNGMWGIVKQGIVLLDPDRSVRNRIARRPDGKWFGNEVIGSVGPNGELVVFDGTMLMCCDPAGEWVGAISLPGMDIRSLLHTGELIVVADRLGIGVWDLRSNAMRRVQSSGGQHVDALLSYLSSAKVLVGWTRPEVALRRLRIDLESVCR